jgi:hypothetical protein
MKKPKVNSIRVTRGGKKLRLKLNLSIDTEALGTESTIRLIGSIMTSMAEALTQEQRVELFKQLEIAMQQLGQQSKGPNAASS